MDPGQGPISPEWEQGRTMRRGDRQRGRAWMDKNEERKVGCGGGGAREEDED